MPQSRIFQKILLIWLAFLCCFALPKSLPEDPADIEVGEKYTAPITRMRPTQFAVGRGEVLFRAKHVSRLQKADEELYKEYLKEKRPDVVIGPGGELYVVDGHHILSALQSLGVKEVKFKVIANWQDKVPIEKFWKSMIKHGYTMLKDEKGNERSWKELPKYISRLKNDPFRTLAWMTQRVGAWDDEGIPFQEFFWAEYYRKHLTLSKNPSEEEMVEVAKKAIRLTRKRKASDLPGYKRFKKSQCDAMLKELIDLVP